MELHIRVYNAANLEAMRCLNKTAYMVLHYLTCRADHLGRCFPSAERIAEDIGCHSDVVYRQLQALEEMQYIGYLRRNAQDTVTGRWLPNVYIVNPFFICLAIENHQEAVNLWRGVYPDFAEPFRHFIGINQQQEPASETNASEPASETNNNNQHPSKKEGDGHAQKPENSESPQTRKQKSEKQKAKSKKLDSDSENTDKEQQSEASQRSRKRGSSARNYDKNYNNPDPIAAPIPDDVLENLANRVNKLGVPIPLARGFVVAYGGLLVESALLQLAATKRNGQEVKNEAGFFRHILQNNLVDSSLPEILTTKEKNYVSSWGNFAEHDHE